MLLTNLLILGLASATVSVTVAQSRVFLPLRTFIKGKSEWLGELFSCPYCMGHWVSAVLVSGGLTHPAWQSWVISWLAVTAISSLIAGAIGRLYGE